MKLFVTFITDTQDEIEKEFNIPEGVNIVAMGLELDTPDDDRWLNNRMTIVRIPFSSHGGTSIHTMCHATPDDDGIMQVEM